MKVSGGSTFRLALMVSVGLLLARTGLGAEDRVATIYLRSGQIVRAPIVRQNQVAITILENGRSRVIAKSSIKRILFTPQTPAAEASGTETPEKKQAALKKRQEEEKQRQTEAERTRQAAALETARAARRVSEGQSLYGEGIWRSLIFPGWGQYHRGEQFKGEILMGTAATGLLVWAALDQRYRRITAATAESLRDGSILAAHNGTRDVLVLNLVRANQARVRQSSAAFQASAAAAFYGGLYAFNVVDAFIFQGGRVGFYGRGEASAVTVYGPEYGAFVTLEF